MTKIVAPFLSPTPFVSTSNTTSYTDSARPLGPPQSTRHIVVAINATSTADTPSISSVTVGGVSASSVKTLAAATRVSALYIAAVPTGLTGDIVVTFGATVLNCGIAAWALYNIGSTTPVDTDEVAVVSASVAFPSIDTVADGFAIWTLVGQLNLSTYTWATATEQYDGTVESPVAHSGASVATTGSGLAVTATASNAATLSTGVCASFQPGAGGVIFAIPLVTGDSPGWTGSTSANAIGSAALVAEAGNQIRVTWQGGSAEGYVRTKAYIGNKASSGDDYDADSLSQLLFSGAAGFTVSAANVLTSDWLTWTRDTAKGIVVKDYGTSSTDTIRYNNTIASASNWYVNSDDAATANATGYTQNAGDASRVEGIAMIEVRSAGILRQMMQHHGG